MALPDNSPEWIQAIFTIILVVITGVYAYFTHKMAKANQEMANATTKQVEATTKQVEFIEKEHSHRVVVDMAKNTYWKIYQLINCAKKSLISYSLFDPITPERSISSSIIEFPLITPILDGRIYSPDKILEKYDDQILDCAKKYDGYVDQKNEIINRILSKIPKIWKEYSNLFNQLNPHEVILSANSPNPKEVFQILITDSDIDETNHCYQFIEDNKDKLISFLNENGFSEDMDDYKKMKEEFIQLIDEFLQLLDELFRDWQREYAIQDSEFKEAILC